MQSIFTFLSQGCSQASLALILSFGFLVSICLSRLMQSALYLTLMSSLKAGYHYRILCITSTSLSPLKGGLWVIIMQRMTPVDHMSHFSSYFLSKTSGATQQGVPTLSVSFSSLSVLWWAIPKSMIFRIWLFFSKSIFSGLRSRWMTPMWLRQSSTFKICLMTLAMYSSESSLQVMIFLKSSPPSQSSRMSTQCDLQSQTSQSLTMLMWSRDFMMVISMNSFSCSCLPRVDFLIFLAARKRPVYLDLTLLTLPKPPLPISLTITQSSRQLRFFILMKLFHFMRISSYSFSASTCSASYIYRYSSSFIFVEIWVAIPSLSPSISSPSSISTGLMYLKVVLLPGFDDFAGLSKMGGLFYLSCKTLASSFPILLQLQISYYDYDQIEHLNNFLFPTPNNRGLFQQRAPLPEW